MGLTHNGNCDVSPIVLKSVENGPKNAQDIENWRTLSRVKPFVRRAIPFCRRLSRQFFKQLRTGAVLLNFMMALVDVEAKGHE